MEAIEGETEEGGGEGVALCPSTLTTPAQGLPCLRFQHLLQNEDLASPSPPLSPQAALTTPSCS